VSAKIISFPGPRAAMCAPTPTHRKNRNADTHKVSGAKHPTARSSDGRRKKGSKSQSVEPSIQEIPGENGGKSYRVQIRKSVGGQTFSFTKTFSQLSMAKKRKRRKIAEIEMGGVLSVSSDGETVADAVSASVRHLTQDSQG
jgi:hypothetical protein